MSYFPSTIILRHRKENLKKCSLTGLEKRKDFIFLKYPIDSLPDLSNFYLLTLNAPPLSEKDVNKGLFLVDATWRYAKTMIASLPKMECRCIPSHFRTAYPRYQTECSDPERGLASIEALFIAYFILGKDTQNLLDGYYWKDEFLSKNSKLFSTNTFL